MTDITLIQAYMSIRSYTDCDRFDAILGAIHLRMSKGVAKMQQQYQMEQIDAQFDGFEDYR